MKGPLLAGAALSVLGIAMPAHAQSSSAAPTDQYQTGNDEDAIIVTATRREEKLQDVPVAVTVFDAEMRDRKGLSTIQDFTNFTPGLSYDSANDRLSLRGVGRLTNTIGSDPGVAVYNDGFYTSSAWEATKSPMYVDRVEVLRGPQGTLYGRNSIGGSLNVISKRPTDEPSLEFRGSLEEYAGMIVSAAISGPIVGDLKGKLSYQYGTQLLDGLYKNINLPTQDEGFMQRRMIEAQLQYDFSPSTQLWFKWSHTDVDDHTRTSNLVTPYGTTYFMNNLTTTNLTNRLSLDLVPNPAFGYTVPNPGVLDPFKINTNIQNDQKLRKNHNFVANFKTELGGATLKYVGGYSQYLYTDYSDYDDTAAGIVNTSFGTYLGPYSYNGNYLVEYMEDKNYWSNELTLSNTDSGTFNWLAGLYQYREHYFQPYTLYVDGPATDNMSQALLNPTCLDENYGPATGCGSNPRRLFYRQTGDLTVKSYAAFGQADYEISPGLKLTVGLRYSQDKKRGIETKRMINWDPTAPLPGCFGAGCGAYTPAFDVTRGSILENGVRINGTGEATRTLNGKWNGLSWRLGADYKANSDLMFFGSYSRGFKAGGLSLGAIALDPYTDSEKVDAFELGMKSNPLPRTMFNATAFYYRYSDAQVPLTVRPAGGGVATEQFFNIPKTRSIGLEFEGDWRTTDWLTLSAVYSYLDAKVTGVDGLLFQDVASPGSPFIDITGNRMPQVSRHKFAASAMVTLPTSIGDFYWTTNYAYRSNAYYSVMNNPRSLAPGWDQVDTRLSYVVPEKNLTVIAYVRNLFNTRGYLGSSAQGFSRDYGRAMTFTVPRAIGAELQFKF